MPTYFDAVTIERARVLVETTARTLEDIAVELGTSVQTLRNWIKKYGWRRHPEAPRARPKLPPEKEGPARRIYEGGAGVGDLAVLLDCHESYVHRVAKQRGWRRPGTNAAAADLPAALAESEATRATYDAIAARLREPDLPRHELLRLAQMGQAVALVEMLAGATVVEGRVDAAVQLARLASELPEEPPVPRQLSPEEQERESAALIAELVEHFSGPVAEQTGPATAAAADAAA